MRHQIRPYKWEEQIVLLLPQIKAHTRLIVPTPVIRHTVLQMFKVWDIPEIVVDVEQQLTRNCRRCGGQVYGKFCEGSTTLSYSDQHQHSPCDGSLHAQDCPCLWGVSTWDEIPDWIIVVHCGKTRTPTGKVKCNCGGTELEHSLRHAANQLQLS